MKEELVRVSSKGQVVLPAVVRRRLHVQKGQPLALAVQDGVILLKPVSRLSELEGVLKGANLNVKRTVARLRREWDAAR